MFSNMTERGVLYCDRGILLIIGLGWLNRGQHSVFATKKQAED